MSTSSEWDGNDEFYDALENPNLQTSSTTSYHQPSTSKKDFVVYENAIESDTDSESVPNSFAPSIIVQRASETERELALTLERIKFRRPSSAKSNPNIDSKSSSQIELNQSGSESLTLLDAAISAKVSEDPKSTILALSQNGSVLRQLPLTIVTSPTPDASPKPSLRLSKNLNSEVVENIKSLVDTNLDSSEHQKEKPSSSSSSSSSTSRNNGTESIVSKPKIIDISSNPKIITSPTHSLNANANADTPSSTSAKEGGADTGRGRDSVDPLSLHINTMRGQQLKKEESYSEDESTLNSSSTPHSKTKKPSLFARLRKKSGKKSADPIDDHMKSGDSIASTISRNQSGINLPDQDPSITHETSKWTLLS